MVNQRVVLVILAGLAIGAATGLYGAGLPDIDGLISGEQETEAIYDIDTEEEWINSFGKVWSPDSASFEGGRFHIESYNVMVWKGSYDSYVGYQARGIRLSEISLNSLERLTARGNIGAEGVEAALRVKVMECGSLAPSWNCSVEYDSGFITDKGTVSIDKRLSGSPEGFVIVETGVGINSSSPVSGGDETYWDTIRVAGS